MSFLVPVGYDNFLVLFVFDCLYSLKIKSHVLFEALSHSQDLPAAFLITRIGSLVLGTETTEAKCYFHSLMLALLGWLKRCLSGFPNTLSPTTSIPQSLKGSHCAQTTFRQ